MKELKLLVRLLCPWGFSRKEYWNGLPFPPPGDLPNPGWPTLQADSLPSESPRKTLEDLGLSNSFFDMTSTAQASTEKVDKLDFFKIKNFCESKHTLKKVSSQPT